MSRRLPPSLLLLVLFGTLAALGLADSVALSPAQARDVAPASAAASEFVGHYASAAVATDREQASLAARRILQAGGSAADAAAAAMLTLGVVNPSSSGFGGGGFALYYEAAAAPAERFTFIDFRERAPGAATASMYADAPDAGPGPINAASQLGGLASGVPGEPAGVAALVERFGRLSLSQVAAPAIELAERGFEMDDKLAGTLQVFRAQLAQDATMRGWLGGQDPVRAGQRLTQPLLARTLRTFAREGAAAVYGGSIGRAIVRANRARGGIMALQDLRDYRVARRLPLHADALGFHWVTAPPPSAGGSTMLQSLRMLENLRPSWRSGRERFLHALLESWKGPFLDRARYFGDPDHVPLPLDALLDPARDAERARRFHPLLALDPQAFDLPLEPENDEIEQPDNAGTSHLCVVDAQGNIAAVTTTVNLPFGARYSAAGFAMNDEMDDFARAVGERNAFGLVGGARNLPGPGRRPVSTMMPTIVLDAQGRPVLCVGASGGSRIVTATEQVALNMLVLGMSAEDAVTTGRVHHQAVPNVYRSETIAPLDARLMSYLRERGHQHEPMRNIAIVQAIQIEYTPSSRLLHAVSDPRKGGLPAGY